MYLYLSEFQFLPRPLRIQRIHFALGYHVASVRAADQAGEWLPCEYFTIDKLKEI
jgi:hypothetical protein